MALKEIPYLPDIMQGVVERVDQYFWELPTDNFHVFFDKGILRQVARKVYSEKMVNVPLVWLVMNFDDEMGKSMDLFSCTYCNLIIAMPTKPEYTQQERDDIIFKPILLPVYQKVIDEIFKEPWFSFVTKESIKYRRRLRPFWGIGDVNGQDKENLFKNFVDVIMIQNLELNIRDTPKRVC